MKELILFIMIIISLTACSNTSGDTLNKPSDMSTGLGSELGVKKIGEIRWMNVYKITVDSTEYIVTRCSDGVAIAKHRDLKSTKSNNE